MWPCDGNGKRSTCGLQRPPPDPSTASITWISDLNW
jgi:hypothetical protein